MKYRDFHAEAMVTWVNDVVHDVPSHLFRTGIEGFPPIKEFYSAEIHGSPWLYGASSSYLADRRRDPRSSTCPTWWVPRRSGHWFAEWSFLLAREWKPNVAWELVRTDDHSAVVDPVSCDIFCPQLYKSPYSEIAKMLGLAEQSDKYENLIIPYAV